MVLGESYLKKMRAFTTVWGPYVDWMERTIVRSLLWPANNLAVKDSAWLIWTKRADEAKVLELARRVGFAQIDIGYLPDEVEGNHPMMGAVILKAFLQTVKMCLNNGEQLLTLPPDTVMGDGSINALRLAGQFGDTCVAVPHIRVDASILGSLTDSPMSNPALVSVAMKHQHKAFSESEIGRDMSGSFVGGIAWQKLGKNLWSVQHALPTIYLANLKQSDYHFFGQSHDGLAPTYGCFDHAWPQVLVKEQRQRTIGSSDACFIAELTRAELNVPPLTKAIIDKPDAFWRHLSHNLHNKQNLFIMRGE